MEFLIASIILLYVLSTVFYTVYFFLQKNVLQKAGYFLLLAGFLCHCLVFILGFAEAGHMTVRNLHETLSISSWAVAGVFLLLRYKVHLKILGLYAAPLAAGVMIAASFVPSVPVETNDIYKSIWFVMHIITIFIGDAGFAMAFGIGVMYLIQEHAIKTKKHGFFYKRLPSLEMLDSTGYACIVIGFTMLTIGLVTGLIYAKMSWGRFWSWDPKEVWSGITWLLYAVLLHERLAVGWRGRRAAIMAIIGFAVLLFTFFGVNSLLEGHHGEFTVR